MSKRQREPIPSRVVQTAMAAAGWFGCVPASVGQWLAEGMPREENGDIDLRRMCKWHAINKDPGGLRGTSGSEESTDEAERRKKVADADRAEMARDREKGDLMPRLDHVREQYELVDSFVRELERFPARVAPLLTAAKDHLEVVTILQDHVRTMRIQLAAKHTAPPPDAETKEQGPG